MTLDVGGGGGGGGGQFGAFSASGEERKKRTTRDRDMLARLYKYLKPYRRNLGIAVVAIVVNATATVLIPYMSRLVIDYVVTPKDASALSWWVPLFLLITLAFYLAQFVQTWQIRIMGEKIVAGIREDIVAKLQIISLRYFSEGEIGRIISRPINDANILRMFFRQGLANIILNTTSILGALIIIFFLNVKLAALAVLIMPLAVFVAFYLGRFSRRVNRSALIYTSGMVSKMQESLSGIKVIKAFVQQDKALRDFDAAQKNVVSARVKAVAITSAYQPIVYIIRVVGTALILWFGATMAMSGEISLGTFVAFTEYQLLFFNPILQLVISYDLYQQAMAATERMFDIIDTNPEVEDPPDERAAAVGKSEDVRFRDVTFGYNPKVLAISDINLEVDSQNISKLAIVGPTGAGKSTIINLLARFYDPLSGKIELNGQDIKNIKISELRSHQSTVLQDSFLFPMSIADNIRFGKPDASDEEVVEAAKMVGAHEFIMNLKGGYDYVIQEGASNISIGQRQLISFARAILTDPDILILDEATSSIDPYTELVIQNALKKLLAGRLVIIIAHRLSTIRLCDEIKVVDHGRVVESGTHEELMARGGIYASFYKMQFKEEKGLE